VCYVPHVTPENPRLYFRQLLAGRDFATQDPVARQMVNFVYLLGDRETGEALVVDPAYAVRELVDIASADGMKLVGALATHFHADHVGGDLFGHSIEGVRELLAIQGMKVHLQRTEAPWLQRATELSTSDLCLHDSGDTVAIGAISIQLIHTPGHTPGGQCFLLEGRLVAGDTLFLDGCGRTDFPGGDPSAMYFSLTQRLSHVPDDAILFPGHRYSEQPSASMGVTRRENFVFKPKTEQEWLRMFAR
jgi:glyoxylase-like metal-dependent hydrolase (beta-lactamase superfamily II)